MRKRQLINPHTKTWTGKAQWPDWAHDMHNLYAREDEDT